MILFDVTPDGAETAEVTADSRDVLHWELRKNGRHLGMIQSTPRMSDLIELAWLACKRTGRWDGELNDFREQVAVLPKQQPDTEAELLDPTQRAA